MAIIHSNQNNISSTTNRSSKSGLIPSSTFSSKSCLKSRYYFGRLGNTLLTRITNANDCYDDKSTRSKVLTKQHQPIIIKKRSSVAVDDGTTTTNNNNHYPTVRLTGRREYNEKIKSPNYSSSTTTTSTANKNNNNNNDHNKNKNKSIRFAQEVSYIVIPNRNEYTNEMKRTLYNNKYDLSNLSIRAKQEILYEQKYYNGYVLEENQYIWYCGKLIHPVHIIQQQIQTQQQQQRSIIMPQTEKYYYNGQFDSDNDWLTSTTTTTTTTTMEKKKNYNYHHHLQQQQKQKYHHPFVSGYFSN